MQQAFKIKTRWNLSILAGLIMAGALSACGGGSGGVDRNTHDENAVIIKPVNPLSKYIGSYPDNYCWTNITSSIPYSGITSELVFSASTKPNTLNLADTHFFYGNDNGRYGIECNAQIGTSTQYAEVTYVGTLSSVEFSNSTKLPISAEKVLVTMTNVKNIGVSWEEVGIEKQVKGLIAKEGNTVYFSDELAATDTEGFPTKLDEDNFLILP